MTTGRTANKYTRVYVDGYDLSGHSRSIGPLDWTYEEGVDDPMSSALKGAWLGQCSASPGTLNAIFDNTALTGLHARLGTPAQQRNVLVAMGMQAEPTDWDPCFMAQCRQSDYMTAPEATPTALTVKFSPTSGTSTVLNGCNPWGLLLNPVAEARTDVNAWTGFDPYGIVSTDFGGWMMYQVLASVGSGNIQVTLKVQDSDTNVDGDYDDLLSSGIINTGAAGVCVPCSGVVALAPTATVRQYVRWQIVFGTGGNACTSITFALGFARNFHR